MGVMRQQLFENNVTAVDTGWIDASAFDKGFSIIFQGIVSGDTFDVRVSNRVTKPASTDTGVIYGSAVTADGIVKVTETYGWIMVRRTAITGGGYVDVYLAAARPAKAGYN